MTEFSYNNKLAAQHQKWMYIRRCHTLVYWSDVSGTWVMGI